MAIYDMAFFDAKSLVSTTLTVNDKPIFVFREEKEFQLLTYQRRDIDPLQRL